MSTLFRSLIILTTLILTAVALPQVVFAHCDTVDGPVVIDAKAALAKGDITPVLKWIKPDNELEIKQAFKHTLKVRTLNSEARDLADNYFFETVVRVHRAGEGAPYTGLKPAGTKVDEGIETADESLKTGEVKPVIETVVEVVSKGIKDRFARVNKLKQGMNTSVAQGREYVEAYVDYIHYVEGLLGKAESKSTDHETEAPKEEHQH